MPIVTAEGKVVGVLGIGMMSPYEFSETESAALSACAALLPASLA